MAHVLTEAEIQAIDSAAAGLVHRILSDENPRIAADDFKATLDALGIRALYSPDTSAEQFRAASAELTRRAEHLGDLAALKDRGGDKSKRQLAKLMRDFIDSEARA